MKRSVRGRSSAHSSGRGRRFLRRGAQAWSKFRWGARVVGFWPSVVGVGRLLTLRVGGPKRSRVALRSGAVIGFEVPSQVPPALVMFRDLIDPEFSLLTELARPDWVVVDVGAAIGQFSVFAGRLPVAVVHAFEPSSSNIASFQLNIAENGLADRVRVHQAALSNWVGEQEFSTQGNTYLSRLDQVASDAIASETVAVRTLAGECERLGVSRISVLKVNVAGYEPEVLAGAVPLLASGSVSILVLLIGARSMEWYRRCAGWGYRFFFYVPTERTLCEVAELELHVLERPPWPARHVIAIHRDVVVADVFAPAKVTICAPCQSHAAGASRG
jgi:FkbM family methyltransferase